MIRTLKFLRSNALTAPLYRALLQCYVFAHSHWSRPIGAWISWRAKTKGTKTFFWSGYELVERWNDPYALHALRGDLKMFDGMRRAVERFAPPSPVIFDVGANIGLFSLACAGIEGATIYGFEPVRETFAHYAQNIRVNNRTNVQCQPFGLSHRPSRLWIGPPHPGADSPSFAVRAADTAQASGGEEADFTTLDAFVAEHGIDRIDYLKIDAEGHDLQVLAGASAALARFRPVLQLEYETRILRRFDSGTETIRRLADDGNYAVFEIWKNTVLGVEDTAALFNAEVASKDLILVPRERLSESGR